MVNWPAGPRHLPAGTPRSKQAAQPLGDARAMGRG